MGGDNVYFNFTSNLAGWDFNGQNLSKTHLSYSSMAGTDLRWANLPEAGLNAVDLTGADARGALGLNVTNSVLRNFIMPDGTVAGLSLAADERLVIRDDDGAIESPSQAWLDSTPPIAVRIADFMTLAETSTLQLLFDADPWDSLISFEPGIPINLGGTLELTFADEVNPATQLGRTFDLFGWTGVNPTGRFDVVSQFRWDTSKLYSTGEVRLLGVPEPSYLFTIGVCLVAIVSMQRSRSSVTGRFVQVAARLAPLMAYAYASRPDILFGHRVAIQETLRGQAEGLIARYCE